MHQIICRLLIRFAEPHPEESRGIEAPNLWIISSMTMSSPAPSAFTPRCCEKWNCFPPPPLPEDTEEAYSISKAAINKKSKVPADLDDSFGARNFALIANRHAASASVLSECARIDLNSKVADKSHFLFDRSGSGSRPGNLELFNRAAFRTFQKVLEGKRHELTWHLTPAISIRS